MEHDRRKRDPRVIYPDPKAWNKPPVHEPWHRYDPVALAVIAVVTVACVLVGVWAVWWLLTH